MSHSNAELAHGDLGRAKAFLEAATRLGSTFDTFDEVNLHMPLNVLLFHTAELTLKAMLKTGHVVPKHHKLEKLLQAASDLELPLSDEFKYFVDVHSPKKQVETFRYGPNSKDGYKMVGYLLAIPILARQIALTEPIVMSALQRPAPREV